MVKGKRRLDMHGACLFELGDGGVVYVLKDKCDVAGFAKNSKMPKVRKWLQRLKATSNLQPNL